MAHSLGIGAGSHTPVNVAKRTADVLSPTMISPPTKAVCTDLVDNLIAALQDDRTMQVLKDVMSVAITEKLVELTTEVTVLKKENIALKGKLNMLQTKCDELDAKQDDLEQYGRRNCLRLHTAIPEVRDEDTDEIVIQAAQAIGANVTREDISRSHRVGRKRDDKPRAIIFRLLSYRKRREIYVRRKQLPEDQFLTEDLTARRAHLLYLCRQLRKKEVLQYVWTSDGRVLVKEPGEHAQTLLITCARDLIRFGPAPPEKMPSLLNDEHPINE